MDKALRTYILWNVSLPAGSIKNYILTACKTHNTYSISLDLNYISIQHNDIPEKYLCMQNCGSRYLNPRSGPREHPVTNLHSKKLHYYNETHVSLWLKSPLAKITRHTRMHHCLEGYRDEKNEELENTHWSTCAIFQISKDHSALKGC